VKGTKEDTSSLDGNSAKYLADRWGVPYREAHTLSIDPTVLEILDREESKRLRVLPLEFGPDGPVFAVAEPSEERFAAVRNIAGDHASFVIVAKETLDALLNSKVFNVSGNSRRTSFVGNDSNAEGSTGTTQETDTPPTQEEAHVTAHDDATLEGGSYDHTNGNGGSTEALDALLNQIAAGTGTLRAQVDQLTESLETTQRELREANEQLAEATRVKEEHDALVSGQGAELDQLRAELDQLRAELERSNTMNSSMTSRLEEVARALSVPIGNDEHSDG
jgi:hypothetical protein